MPADRPTEAGLAAWRAFLVAHSVVTDRLEADLRKSTGLSLAWYEVLLHLWEAPDQRLRMTDLARAVLLSKSGLTRLVARMCDEGFIARTPASDDRRSIIVELTPKGRSAFRRAAPDHLRAVQEQFGSRFSDAEADDLRELLVRIGAGG
jgi:DNA-binding MarR family transcriptional regulator